MTLQSSPPISLLDVITEFTNVANGAPSSLQDLYRGGNWVPDIPLNAALPALSGGNATIKLLDCLGCANGTTVVTLTTTGSWSISSGQVLLVGANRLDGGSPSRTYEAGYQANSSQTYDLVAHGSYPQTFHDGYEVLFMGYRNVPGKSPETPYNLVVTLKGNVPTGILGHATFVFNTGTFTNVALTRDYDSVSNQTKYEHGLVSSISPTTLSSVTLSP